MTLLIQHKEEPGFFAFLGSPNGGSIITMLNQHKEEPGFFAFLGSQS